MLKNEKALYQPGGADEGNGNSNDRNDERISYKDNITKDGKRQVKISDLLKRGEQNAIKAADLLKLAGLSDTRQLRDAISEERRAGKLILSTCRPPFGYFLPALGADGREEICRHIQTIKSRAVNSLAILKAAREELRRIDGQMELFDREVDNYE